MPVLHRTTAGSIAAVTTGALLLGIAPAALADGPSAVEKTAAAVERATGTTDIAPSEPFADGTLTAKTANEDGPSATVTLPATADGTVNTTTSGGLSVSIGLPNTSNAQAVKTANGTVVYPDAARGTDLALQPTTDGGARALVTINNSDAAREYRFDLHLPDGAVTQQLDDGTVLILAGAGEDAEIIGAFDAPWAEDANGKAVATAYRVEDGALVQSVEFDHEAAFPIVADPQMTLGKRVYLHFGIKEVKGIAKIGTPAKYLSAAVCKKVPSTIAIVLKPRAVCAYLVTKRVGATVKVFKDAAKRSQCVRVTVPFTPVGEAMTVTRKKCSSLQ
ncbi:hypothetical protein AB0H82_24150 [Streptomyces sp. NPDC050732]|uniref:hypothetical protein n=1 Tax=Streptomyces sp. NPDC050732 TaxID=3154632 RepID=UPI003418050D